MHREVHDVVERAVALYALEWCGGILQKSGYTEQDAIRTGERSIRNVSSRCSRTEQVCARNAGEVTRPSPHASRSDTRWIGTERESKRKRLTIIS